MQEETEEGQENGVNGQSPSLRAKQEIAQLTAESEIPLEELLASYQLGREDGDEDDAIDDDEDDVPDADEEDDEVDDDEDSEGDTEDLTKQGRRFGTELLLLDAADGTVDNADEAAQQEKLSAASAAANEAQPTGNTLSTTTVKTKVPFLLKHTLREYQHIGLDWLVTMYEKRLNGILADEMVLSSTSFSWRF